MTPVVKRWRTPWSILATRHGFSVACTLCDYYAAHIRLLGDAEALARRRHETQHGRTA